MRSTTLLAFVGLLLASCGPNASTPPQVGALSGALLPAQLGVGGQLNIADVQGNQQEVKLSSTVALAGGHLPADVFALEKTDIATAINSSTVISADNKAKLIASANAALDQLATAINTALDNLPRHMAITPGDRLGDVAWSNFTFTPTSKPAFNLGGFYNVVNTEYRVEGITFVNGGSNAQGGVLTVSACDFRGKLTGTTATLRCGTDTLAAVNKVGTLNLALGLQVDLNFKRD